MADVLRSELLHQHGFVHGFSLRTGGVSGEPYASLNLGRAVGDAPSAVAENLLRFARSVGFEPERLFEVSQVHGARTVSVRPGATPEALRVEQADAMVATAPGAAVAIRVADCVPVLMADPRSGAVAAAHAGWRGCVAGVVPAVLDALAREANARPADVLVAIGPHIRVGAFEVGEEVAEELVRAAPEAHAVLHGAGKPRVDLSRVLRAQLAAAGVGDAHVEDVGGCTYAESERFFSYRRDGQRSGRHLAAIARR